MKATLVAASLALPLGLGACASTSGFSPTVQSDIGRALALSCPIVASTQGVVANNAKTEAAYALLLRVCPPHRPPTNAIVAAVDILNAYSTVKAVLK
jgi:hypothetical protein